MSIVSPTLVPREPVTPLVLSKVSHFGPTPLVKRDRFHGRFSTRRDLQREMDDLSDEENDLEDCNIYVRNRGFSWYIPVGRHATKLEEKNDAEEDSEGSESGQSGDHSPSINGEENDESGVDLDASMEDRDDERNSDDVDDDMTDSEEYEEEPSDI
ncbi:hypothetical protein SCLCIDRAFT_317090 [Scleroderma citrinum Foug A]|uniref:Uncharacterized protein n=1 Tax=Scleroderma citrinum Foug A TaxID=1036808 RepID=A0A0C3DG34_9AGAM|nr:hypothetical protein SCLCIDRAFT_317090 [Scleroderma citrinum Foug A]